MIDWRADTEHGLIDNMDRLLLILLVAGLAVLRLWFSGTAEPIRHAEDSLRQRVLAKIAEAKSEEKIAWLFHGKQMKLGSSNQGIQDGELGTRDSFQVTLQQYDPFAVVAILVGEDGQPGVAGVDDNGNGITDDRSELGATHSDDRCETMNSEIAKQQEPRPLVLQRGAFVNVSSPEQRIDNAEKRLRLSGESAGCPISFLISVDAAFITD